MRWLVLAALLTGCNSEAPKEPKPRWNEGFTLVNSYQANVEIWRGPSGTCYLNSFRSFSAVNCEDFE